MSAATHPTPTEIVSIVGDTSERAVAYVQAPDARLGRLPRGYREQVLADLPPVTAGGMLGPAGLARHFVASSANGRYRDLFHLWELFRAHPDACRPVLAERQPALEKAQAKLRTAARIALRGRTNLLAEDVERAQGLIWQWLRTALVEELRLVGERPALASAVLLREPELQVPLPEQPSDRWLSEAAAAAAAGPLAPAVEELLGAHLDRLPGTVATLSLARDRFPQRIPALVDRVDLGSPEIGALLAWCRDHGQGPRLQERILAAVVEQLADDRQAALASWWSWRQRGVALPLPEELADTDLDELDLTRPETAELARTLVDRGVDVEPQRRLDELAARNRQLAEKAYEAFVCAGHEVTLPAVLRSNPMVEEGTRCPWCEAWTWVRPGHEQRCPRAGEPAPPPPEPQLGEEWSIDEPAASDDVSTTAEPTSSDTAPEAQASPAEGDTAPEPQASPAEGATSEQASSEDAPPSDEPAPQEEPAAQEDPAPQDEPAAQEEPAPQEQPVPTAGA